MSPHEVVQRVVLPAIRLLRSRPGTVAAADGPGRCRCIEQAGGDPLASASAPAPASADPFDIADQAIGLFLEHRDQHGQDEGQARRSATLEVAEGTSVDLAALTEDAATDGSLGAGDVTSND
jgi:hypothetical protein